ncbi:unnamed protein product, partial [Tilletia laevis]
SKVMAKEAAAATSLSIPTESTLNGIGRLLERDPAARSRARRSWVVDYCP